MEIKIRDQFNVHYITLSNSTIWNRIDKFVESLNTDEDILLDFKDVRLENPQMNKDFHNILRRHNVRFKIYNYSNLVEAIDMACKLCNAPTGRVENIGSVEIEQKKPDKNIDADPDVIEKLLNFTTIEGNELRVDYCKAYYGMTKQSMINSLDEAIQIKLSEASNITKITVDLNKIMVQKAIIKYLVELVDKYSADYEFELLSLIGKEDFEMHSAIKNGLAKDLTAADKVKIMKRELKKNVVGLLIMYENKRGGKDTYGRVGNGEILWCRYAILKNVVNKGGIPMAIFKVYHLNDFHTTLHKSIENLDSQELKEDTLEIEIDKLGFFDYFLGSEFHFNLPIQFDKEGTVSEWVEVEDCKAGIRNLTIPELAKHVLDENNIEYNREELQKAIDWTYEVLNKDK